MAADIKFFLSLIILVLMTVPARAETIICPDTGYRLTRTDAKRNSGEVYLTDVNFLKYHQTVCQYGRKNKIVLNWLAPEPVQELASAKSTCSWVLKNSHGKAFRTIWGKTGANLYSNTHMVSARLYLSKKEAKSEHRQAWEDYGYDLIRSKMDEALSCEEVLGGDVPHSRPSAPVGSGRPVKAAPQRRSIPQPAAAPDNVDAEIDDILDRLKGGQ